MIEPIVARAYMKISTTYVLSSARERVFAALVDPELLRRSIPGCEELRLIEEDTYAARLKIGVAGLKGNYSGTAKIRDKRPPDALTLTVDGKGATGFVRGTANIQLSVDPAGTRVACDADAQVGGLIAAVGSRLIETTARKLTDEFFQRLASQIDSPAELTSDRDS